MPTPVLPVALANVTDALIAMLGTVTSKHIGDADAPTADGMPYAVVTPLPGGSSEGDIANPDGTMHRIIQITSVGATRWQAEAMRDMCHQAVLARNANGFIHPIDAYTENGATKSLATDVGLAVVGRAHDSSGGVDADGTVFNAHERYDLWVSPA